ADLQAARVTADWARAGAVGADPMVAARARLQQDVARVRAQVRASGSGAAAALRSARDLAPDPSPLRQGLARALDASKDVELGVLKGTADLLAPLLVTAVQNAANPIGA